MVTIRMDSNLKEFLQKMAEKERRSLTNFMTNAAIVYSKEHLENDWEEEKKKDE